MNIFGHQFAVPQRHVKPRIRRRLAQRRANLGDLSLVHSPRAARTFLLGQSREAVLFELPHPIFHRARRIAKLQSDLPWAHALCDQQHRVQPMIIPRIIGTFDFILQPEDDGGRVRNSKGLHATKVRKSHRMRNYL